MKTAVIYARYSSERQTEQSIEGQLHVCNEYAARHDIVIVDTYIDRAMTGTNDKRTDFQRMLKDSAKRAWDYVLVYKIDRFGRNKYELAMNKHTLKLNGVRLISAMENIPDTPEGIILESLLEGMAEYYSAELSQKVKRGMRETRAKGNFGGGNILYGYKVVNKKIVINEDEAEVVRKIFAERVSGKLVSTIAQDLKIMGIKNHNGNLFSADNVYRILINEKYIGIYRHGDEIHTDTYPQIVPTEIFEIVANKIANNKYGKHKPDVYYLLKHKIFCGYCSNPIQSASGTSKNGEVKRYYRCSGKVNHKKCSFIPKRKDILEELVIDTIYEALNESNINYITERILESHKKQNRNYSTLNLLIDEQKEVSSQINNIMKAIEKGIITETTKSRLEELEKKKIDLQIKIEYEQSQDRLAITENDIKYYLLSALKKAPRLMLDALINKIILYNDKAEIYLKYTNHKSPDDNEDHQDFLFYVTSRSYEIDKKSFGGKIYIISYKVSFWI